MEALGGREDICLFFFNLGTRRVWVVSIMPQPCFTPGAYYAGLGSRAGLDAEVGGKKYLCQGLNTGHLVYSKMLY
jgi:hypothetical protein